MTLTELRAERNARLAACDFYFLGDYFESLDETTREAWALYRKKLRDLPAAYEGQDPLPETIDWPDLPFTLSEVPEETEE